MSGQEVGCGGEGNEGKEGRKKRSRVRLSARWLFDRGLNSARIGDHDESSLKSVFLLHPSISLNTRFYLNSGQCWSISQLSQGDARDAQRREDNFRAPSSPDMNVFGLREETRENRTDPGGQGEQNPHTSTFFFFLEG